MNILGVVMRFIDFVVIENVFILRMKYKIKNNKFIITVIERGIE